MPGVFAVGLRRVSSLAACRPWVAIFRRRFPCSSSVEVPNWHPLGVSALAPRNRVALEAPALRRAADARAGENGDEGSGRDILISRQVQPKPVRAIALEDLEGDTSFHLNSTNVDKQSTVNRTCFLRSPASP